MEDANLVEFYARVARFEKERVQGYGHEAPGTLGRMATYGRAAKRRRGFLLPLIFVGMCAFGLKGAILSSVGADAYQTRVERLNKGEGFDRLGGWLMQVDPVTAYVAEKITKAKMALKN